MAGEAEAPDGFVRMPSGAAAAGGFNALTAPWYAREEAGRLVLGFRVLPKHLNPVGTCHGGMLATFCDVMLPVITAYGEPGLGFMPTMSLSLDFLAPTPVGAWVEGRAQTLRRGRRAVFAQGLLTVEGAPVVRASGAFTIPSQALPELAVVESLRTLLAREAAG